MPQGLRRGGRSQEQRCVWRALPTHTHTRTLKPTAHPPRCAQVTDDTEAMQFNTAIAGMMEFVNGAYKWESRPRAALQPFILLLAPYAPHLAEASHGAWKGAGAGAGTRRAFETAGVRKAVEQAHTHAGGLGMRGAPASPTPPPPPTPDPVRRRCGPRWAAAAA